MNIKRLLICLALSFAMLSCAFLGGSNVDLKSKEYSLNFNRPDWLEIDPDTSDKAFRNTKTGSVIVLNTTCKKYDSTSLEHLAQKLLAGISNVEVLDQGSAIYFDREGHHMVISGAIDGVPIKMKTITIRKNRCIYDLSLISNNDKSFESDINALDEVINSMEIK